MLLLEIVRVALGAIRANKLRSFLTMLGIIIGISAVITMVALGEGARRIVQDQIQSLGTNVLTIHPGQAFAGRIDRGSARLTVQGATALRIEATSIKAVVPEMAEQRQITFGSGNARNQVLGTWPTYFDVHRHELHAGRLFTDEEDQARRRVAVLGSEVADRLGVEHSALLVGNTIRIGGIPFEVVGVLEEKGQQGFTNPDVVVYIPLNTARYRVFGTDRLRLISIQTEDERAMTPALAEVDRVLRREHQLRPGVPSNFNIRDPASLLETIEETTRAFTFLLAGIAAVSLLVGGIGIMNIMLVSVTERTREIGVRKALGARRREVLFQFLVEALVLCLAGGALGIALGYGGAQTIERIAEWDTAVSMNAVVMAFVFAAGIGLFFGIWPARRAAKLDPIVALRHE